MNLRERTKHWLGEPLVHFLVGGALVFALYALRGPDIDVGDRRIVVQAEQVERLAGIWAQSWQRPPSATEIDGLIRDFIKEEVYYREALRLGLDRDDTVVRRRLRSKMEFLATSEAETSEPSEAELQAWLDRHAARYSKPATISFDQIFVSMDSGESVAMAKARALLGELSGAPNSIVPGDSISLPLSMEAASPAMIAREFGDGFAAALAEQPRGKWTGPIMSGFGLHLVRIRNYSAPTKASLGEVRQAVENDWRAATRERREAEAYQALLNGYDIVIEKPE